ncbi:MAG TPA: ABC transporter ATP-binding protein [Blastocatellia bacterium]|nr:ABC transporter ATP-binding protein [Blastocatellia bacterium]
MPVLIVDNVEKVYQGGRGGVSALRGVSFQADAGDFIALMGPSGCGKSSLLHLIGGMDRPTRGRVLLDSIAFDALDEEALARLRRRKIGFVFQFFNLLPTLTVAENVALPLLLDGASDREADERTRALIDRVGMAPRRSHYPAELSGGEMQRAAVARAIITRPELILADEPTGNLDTENGEAVIRLLAELNRETGVTIILATHSEESAAHTKRIIRMRDGLIERDNGAGPQR